MNPGDPKAYHQAAKAKVDEYIREQGIKYTEGEKPKVISATVTDDMSAEMLRLVIALGYDPARVHGQRSMGHTRMGVLLSWKDSGRPIAFITDKQLKRRGRDAEFLKRWQAPQIEPLKGGEAKCGVTENQR